MLGAVDAGGRPVGVSSPQGLEIRFVERTRFGVGVRLRNGSSRPVTLVDVRTLEPLRSLARQVGTRLVPWNPPKCSGAHSCPLVTFFRASYGGVRPAPVTAPPGKDVGVQLNFRLDSCGAAPFASAAAVRFVVADYRFGRESLRHETLPLGAATLRLRMPKPADCGTD